MPFFAVACRPLLSGLIGLWAFDAGAGLALDDALALDRNLAAADHWTDLAPAPRPAGLSIAIGGPGRTAPQQIAAEVPGSGGARIVADGFMEGPLKLRIGALGCADCARSFTPEGTAITYGLDDLGSHSELYASWERRHWGPGWTGSLILDGAAPAVPAVGWRRGATEVSTSPWLAWIGPWSADVFLGRLQGHWQPARPYLIGMRLQLQPSDGFQFGLARTMQWGGRGRDESLSSLLDALRGNDNVGQRGITSANEPGNQLAGFDWRWVAGEQRQFSFYGQGVGEDAVDHLPSKYVVLVGSDVRVPLALGTLRVFGEWANLTAGAVSGNANPGVTYRHGVYLQGYTQDGVVLGHPVGGDVQMGSLGAIYQHGTTGAMLVVSAGRGEPTAQLFAAGRVVGVNGAAHTELADRQHVSAGLWYWRDNAGPRGGAQVSWHLRW